MHKSTHLCTFPISRSRGRGFLLRRPPSSCPQPCGAFPLPAPGVPRQGRAALSICGSLPGLVTEHPELLPLFCLSCFWLLSPSLHPTKLTHTHTHTLTHTLAHSHNHTHSLSHTHTHSLTYTHTSSHTHTLTLTCLHTYTHSHILTDTHTRSHTHTHTLPPGTEVVLAAEVTGRLGSPSPPHGSRSRAFPSLGPAVLRTQTVQQLLC